MPDISEFKRPPVSDKTPKETKDALNKFFRNPDPLAVNVTAPPKVEPIQETEATLQKMIEQIDETPEKTYEERLRSYDISKDEAHEIVDVIMRTGTYTRTYKITEKASVTFRSRVVRDQERTQFALEEMQPQFMGTVNLVMTKHNLAASLVEFAGNKFEDTDEGFKRAMSFVGKLPHMLFNVLVGKLSKFDELVLTVMDEGAIENF